MIKENFKLWFYNSPLGLLSGLLLLFLITSPFLVYFFGEEFNFYTTLLGVIIGSLYGKFYLKGQKKYFQEKNI